MLEQELKRIADTLVEIRDLMSAQIGGNMPVSTVTEVAPSDLPEIAPAVEKPVLAKKTEKTKKAEPKAEVVLETSKDDVTDALRELVSLKGPDAAKKVLKKFEAARISEIKPADYTVCLLALQEAIADAQEKTE